MWNDTLLNARSRVGIIGSTTYLNVMSRSWVSNAAWVISVFVPFRLSLFSAVSFLLPIPLLLLLQDQAKISQSRLSFGELSFMICSEAMWIDLYSELNPGIRLGSRPSDFLLMSLQGTPNFHPGFPPTNSLQMFDDCHFLSLTKLRLAILRGPFGHGSNQLVSPEFISRSVQWDPQLTILHQYGPSELLCCRGSRNMLKVLTMSEADKEKPAAAEKDVRAAWVAIRGHPTSEPRSLSQQWFHIL